MASDDLDLALDPQSPEEQSMGKVIDVAIERFSVKPFPEAKLDAIAKEAGVSKRMIHYHFGNKKGLYQAVLSHAIELLQPPTHLLVIDSAIPVDGIRAVVDALYGQIARHPVAAQMLHMESLQHVLPLTEIAPLSSNTEVILHLDRLLMLGQDAGVFRPGISAYDVFYMVASLSFYRRQQRELAINIFGIDPTDEDNTEGVRRMTIDTVLAFLTSNVPHSGHNSYLSTAQSVHEEPESAQAIYE
ncbi:TetR family transcriptional regulator [Corynebacterium sp. zg-331]|uniref:TetR/AcrR family transcriptional regulator n=1 Tax=unclassified Corynebacterium TaxID=2624378 RepID=UPI00128E714C|nr:MULTISPECIES: TetR/AcrR family transcriptional regulator [unclassified Corynebacterium]MBC3185053.1 TetR family transcriptional regulator [Corynebacterium sp. zg-331]MPV51553.1 TetR family transcriptional regulator [Corynebacterium sp. zg331]